LSDPKRDCFVRKRRKSVNTADRADSAEPPRPSRLWWWVGAAFAIQLLAWTAWFVVASHHRIEEIPLVDSGRR
jgi:hypothetical protein